MEKDQGDPKEDLSVAVAGLVKSFRELQASTDKRVAEAIQKRMFIPNVAMTPGADCGTFMPWSTCSAADFFHPRYADICAMLMVQPKFHRKQWEYVYIIHKLQAAGSLRVGNRGIVFGVGRERLPALFASLGMSIVATDAPKKLGATAGWSKTNQHSDSLEHLLWRDLVSDEVFHRNVLFRECDMRAIDDDLVDFDFTWSSCCFEHLGSLEKGIQFVIDSVGKTLKVGGVACHTTEFNLLSDDDTLKGGATVLYRRRDMKELIDRLRDLGHEVEPFVVAPNSHVMDHYVDSPPFIHDPHLKLRLGKYVATSAGIVVRKC